MKYMMLSLSLIILLAGGCTKTLGYAGQYPGYIECKGKGAITGTGTLAVGAGLGAAGTNNFSLQADCGDGFRFQQGKPSIDNDATPIKITK